jgi:hypothetical protein
VSYNTHIIDPNFWGAIDEMIPETSPVVTRITPVLVRTALGFSLEALICRDDQNHVQPLCSVQLTQAKGGEAWTPASDRTHMTNTAMQAL